MSSVRQLALASVIATLVLIGLGVFVRATASGLGCPDWPLCHGGVVPPGDKHPIIEMTHRFAATGVGLMVIVLAVAAWRSYRDVPATSWVAVATVPLVGIQGVLGAITVIRELPPAIVATHLLTSMAVVSCLIVVAAGMYLHDAGGSRQFPWRSDRSVLGFGALMLATGAVLAAVVWVGGYLTESGASTACPRWPYCTDSVFPALDDRQEVIHMAHRYLVVALGVLLVAVVIWGWRLRNTARWANLITIPLAVTYAIQVGLGAFNVWYTFPDALTISHTVFASVIWALLSAGAALVFVPAGATQRSRQPLTAGATL